VKFRATTFDTSHELKSASINLAPKKVRDKVVREVVFQPLIATNPTFAALGLPPTTGSPALFRDVSNARLKSLTSLTSQSPRVPHLVVAVVVFWTQSHEASLNIASVSASR
jgi:hypothetical protein